MLHNKLVFIDSLNTELQEIRVNTMHDQRTKQNKTKNHRDHINIV